MAKGALISAEMSFMPTLYPFYSILVWYKRGICIAQLQLASWKPEVFHSPWLWWDMKTIPRKSRASSNTYFPPSFIYQALYKAILEKQGKIIEQKQDLCWKGWSSLSVWGTCSYSTWKRLGGLQPIGTWCWESLPGKGLFKDGALLCVLESAKLLFVTQTQRVSPKE